MRPWTGRISVRFWGTVLLLTFTVGAATLVEHREPDTLQLPLESISNELAGWNLDRTETLSDQVIGALAPTSYLMRDYRREGGFSQLFVAFYAAQRAGETMHSPKACLPGTGWDFVERSVTTINVDGRSVDINKDKVQNAGKKMWLIYWYQSGDRVIADEYLGKLLLVQDALFRGRTSGAFVRIIMPDAPGMSDQALMIARRVVPDLQRCFRK